MAPFKTKFNNNITQKPPKLGGRCVKVLAKEDFSFINDIKFS